jgi:hypothetical protein
VQIAGESRPRLRRYRITAMPQFTLVVQCDRDPALTNALFTERQNLSVRMRRLRWLMNAFSKRFENSCHTLAL